MPKRSLRDMILGAGVIERGEFEFAGGVRANNKLNLDHLHDYPRKRKVVAARLAKLALKYDPDVLVPIPNGGDVWAELLAADLKKPVCYLKKTEIGPGFRRYDFAGVISSNLFNRCERAVIIDDVGTALTSLRGVLEIPTIKEKAKAFAGIWLRGEPTLEQQVDIPTEWLVREPIPAILPDDSEYFK